VDSSHPSRAIKAGVDKRLSDDELARLGGSHFASHGGQCNRQPGHHRNCTNHDY
jgi:hypothetical protein